MCALIVMGEEERGDNCVCICVGEKGGILLIHVLEHVCVF